MKTLPPPPKRPQLCLTSLLVSPTPPLIFLSFFVYVIMYFSFDGSNFKRIKKFSSDHRLNTAASKPIGLKAENPFTPPSNICRKSQITNQPKRGDQGVHKRGNTRERKNQWLVVEVISRKHDSFFDTILQRDIMSEITLNSMFNVK